MLFKKFVSIFTEKSSKQTNNKIINERKILHNCCMSIIMVIFIRVILQEPWNFVAKFGGVWRQHFYREHDVICSLWQCVWSQCYFGWWGVAKIYLHHTLQLLWLSPQSISTTSDCPPPTPFPSPPPWKTNQVLMLATAQAQYLHLFVAMGAHLRFF
jgi:hypothetical protein